MLSRFAWRTLHGVGTIYRFLRSSLRPVEQAPEMNLHEDENLDEDEEDMSDNELDCTGAVHRRYCRKFNREVAKELYWKQWDEVTEPGNYLKTYGGFHVPQVTMVIPHPEGQMVEFEKVGSDPWSCLDKTAAYLGPLPVLPACLCL